MSFVERSEFAGGQSLHLLVLRDSPSQPGFYERIGLLALEGEGQAVDEVGDLYRDAETRTVTII